MRQREYIIYDAGVQMFYIKCRDDIDLPIDLPIIIEEYLDDYDNLFKGEYVSDLIYEIFDNVMSEATYRAMVKVCINDEILDSYIKKFNTVIVDIAMDNYISELHYNLRESFEEYQETSSLDSPLDFNELKKLFLFTFDYIRLEMIKYHENLLKRFNIHLL